MSLQATGIADVLITSLNQLGRLKFTDLMSDYQNTIALKRIFRKQKATIESGPEVQFNIITDTNHSARHVGIGYVSTVNIPNVMTNGKMPWRHTTWNWGVERRIIQMNSGSAKIVDIAQTQRLAAFGSAILLFERTLWRVPNATTETDDPVGIPYFVVKSATAATAANNNGFNGTVPSGYTVVANINPTSGAGGRWKNYSDAYTAISKEDLIRKMRRARYYTDFMPLVDEIPVYNTGNDYGIYVNYPTVQALEEILESQNENLGSDIASMDGKVVFLRSSVTPVIELDQDTTNPVYLLNWGELGAQALKNEWMNEQHFDKNPNQPTVTFTNTDCSWNLYCRNRRRQAVLSNGTTMPN
jgi:hypothetical protein